MPTTKKPTGLTAARKGGTFIFGWKIADDNYDAGARIQITNRKNRLVNGPVSGRQTEYSKKISLDKQLDGLNFYVQGKRRAEDGKTYSMSAWASKKFDFYLPQLPSVSFIRDTSVDNSGYFSWSTRADDTWWSVYMGFEWESKLFVNWSTSTAPTDWKNAAKGSGSATSAMRTFTEDSALFAVPGYSYTRWFRVRAVGPKGKTAWKYARHTYAIPSPPVITIDNDSPKLTKRTNANGYMCTVKWSAPWRFSRPIDSTYVEYAIATPVTSTTVDSSGKRVVSWSCPDNPGWKTAGVIKSADDTSGLTFPIEENIGPDQVVFLRVHATHDNHDIPSAEVAVTNIKGALSEPEGVVIGTPDPSTHRVSVTVTNTSAITDSFVAVYYKTSSDPNKVTVIDIIPHNTSSATVQCPNWGSDDISIGLRTVFTNYTEHQNDGYKSYTWDNPVPAISMWSSQIVWDESDIPKPPSIELSAPDPTTIRVVWDWPWASANQTELSWADHEDAWESTNQPSSYIVDNINAGQWNISGVNVGTWYVRARLIKAEGENATYGMWSDTKEIKLSSAPAIPSLILSEGVIGPEEEVTCYWAYVTTDGTSQMQADICEATYNEETGVYTYGMPFAKTETAQHITIDAKEQGWLAGEKHYLAVRVISASGEQSQGWSTPVALEIAEPISATVTSTSLVQHSKEVTPDDLGAETETITELALESLPLTVVVDGTGESGTTTILIERAEYYLMDRPDESEIDGFEGEAVFANTFNGDGTFELNQGDFIGYLDDGGTYRLIVSVKDTHGQVAESEPIIFKVYWAHQATIPSGTVEIDHDHDAAILRPTVPSGTEVLTGDVCDIYRLSVDKPQLIYSGATFGQTYVDPYPTIGENGGYRFVYRTFNGDYTTEDGRIAWYDTTEDESNDILTTFGVMINYGNDRITLPYNVTLSNKWAKDFQQTNYLGGHIQGDWNPAVTRTGTITTVGIVNDEYGSEEDLEVIEAIRRLATYPGICHVRTPDGSSFAANINVTEDRENKMINQLANYSLEITRVDSESLDGLTYEEWLEEIGEE